eukprot:Colp12_sorted_trinity150504_noHs@5110
MATGGQKVSGRFQLTVVRGDGIKPKNADGKAELACTIYVDDEELGESGRNKFTALPWNFDLQLICKLSKELQFVVTDVVAGEKVIIGEGSIPLKNLDTSQRECVWVDLEPAGRLDIRFEPVKATGVATHSPAAARLSRKESKMSPKGGQVKKDKDYNIGGPV